LILADYRLESGLFLLFLLQFHFWAFFGIFGKRAKVLSKVLNLLDFLHLLLSCSMFLSACAAGVFNAPPEGYIERTFYFL